MLWFNTIMPKKAQRPCNKIGCPNLTRTSYCDEHNRRRAVDDRPSPSLRGYNYRWQKARKSFIADNPLCIMCLDSNELKPAYAVDHIVPHKGNYNLFWDPDNWQSLCQSHHNAKSARE